MKYFLAFIFLFSSFTSKAHSQADLLEELYLNFKSGNAREIGKHFASSIEFILSDEEDVYSKAQAEQILRDFFVKNAPVSFVKIHAVGSNNKDYRYGVIVLTTKTGKFRVSISLNKAPNGFLINELRIEPEK